jgi:uncharacterized protein RhaS with RHS repeats
MQQRYYDPLCGCFVSTDPVGALSGPFNRYWYANANPYRFRDPDGRKCSTVDGKDSCTFDEFKDKKGNAITRDQALSSGSKLAKLLGVDRGSRILRAEAGMTAKYSAAKSLAANGGSVTIKGNESLGIPDQSISGSAIVSQMGTMPSVAAESLSPTNPREMASVPGVKSPLGTPSNGPITFWKDGSLTPNVPQVFGHEVLHTIYSGIGLANGGWANGAFNDQHQVPFNDASDQIK